MERRMPLSERAHNKACTKILIYFFLILAGTDTGQKHEKNSFLDIENE